MDTQCPPDDYAHHDDCFVNHQDYSFEVIRNLAPLQNATFEPDSSGLLKEYGQYSNLPTNQDLDSREPQAEQAHAIQHMEERCTGLETRDKILPNWNHIYQSVPLATKSLDVDFDASCRAYEFEYRRQVESKRGTNLLKAWLPMQRVDEKRDEGLTFPSQSLKLGQLLWHVVENEKISSNAAELYMNEIVSSAEAAVTSLTQKQVIDPLIMIEDPLDITPSASPGLVKACCSILDPFVSLIDLTSEAGSPNTQHDIPFGSPHMETAASPQLEEEQRAGIPSSHLEKDKSYEKSHSHIVDSPPRKNDNLQDPDSTIEAQYGRQLLSTRRRVSLQSDENGKDNNTQVFVNNGNENQDAQFHICESVSSISKYFFPLSAECNVPTTDECRIEMYEGHNIAKCREQHLPDQLGIKLPNVSSVKTPEYHKLDGQQVPGTSARICTTHEHDDTSNLLDQFMEMRGKKLPLSIHTSKALPSLEAPRLCQVKRTTCDETKSASLGDEVESKLRLSKAPAVLPRREVGFCLVSIHLGHTTLQNLEKYWPSRYLIDRDFCSHVYDTTAPGSGKDAALINSITYEVDIPLSQQSGLIVTSLLRVKQKPLPGSSLLPSLRQRVLSLTRKYQTLVIFVRQEISSDDYVADISASDVTAYAEFICFTAVLDADVEVYLVPGSERTLSKWIIAVMTRHIEDMIASDEIISLSNTTWELFLRRTGLNIRASLALSEALLRDFGPLGLLEFLAMRPSEKSSYGMSLLRTGTRFAQDGATWRMLN